MKPRMAQILHIQQQQSSLVGSPEGDIEHAFRDVIQIHHAGEQQRAHFRNGGAHRMPLFAEDIPKNCRELVGLELEAHVGGALEDEVLGLAHLGDARQVTLDIGRKHRHPGAGKSLCHHLQRHRLSRSGGAGDKTMAVGKPERQPRRLLTLADEYLVAVSGIPVSVVAIASPLHAHGTVGRQASASYRISQVD
jgi:hypothetical protein